VGVNPPAPREAPGALAPDRGVVEPGNIAGGQWVSCTSEVAAATFLVADALKPTRGETIAAIRSRAVAAQEAAVAGAGALARLGVHDPERAHRYGALTWSVRTMSLAQVRVWPGMGGLPLPWCAGSVDDVAARLAAGRVPASASRLVAMLSATGDLARHEAISWLTFLPLLVVPDALLHDHLPHPGSPWALDDGCHRAVLLALLAVGSVSVLVGEPR